jgi:hypothetical protein
MGIRFAGAALLAMAMIACGESSAPTAPSAATSCSFGLSPQAQSAPAAGGTFAANVMSTGSCGWSATSEVNWISVGPSGSGSGTFTYTVAPNASASRIGVIEVVQGSGVAVKVTVAQAGVS